MPVERSRALAGDVETATLGAPAILRAALAVALAVVATAAIAVGVGDPAPAFALRDARSGPVSLDALRGQVVYVDFWASWCGPCRRSFPWMNEMQRRYGGRGLAIVAINVDKNPADAARFLERNPAQFAIAYDKAGATPLAYAVREMPSSYLIDSRGKVVEVEQGFHDERKEALEQRIQALLAAR
ncbi:MAG TPA: TlpA disulfide reductase family protein [Casimicrobiaceae bacterium]|nr:TlpA disulfide reductase family protein [Casimicrobiaceae bacterium]